MEFLPVSMGTRPPLAVEVRAEGVVAARAESAATAVLSAVSRAELRPGVVAAGLKDGNLPDRAAVVAAMRKTLDEVAGRGSERSRHVTLVVPDAAARVLLLDFDELPSKAAEALPVVRFRLKKLLPFEVEGAAVSYQILSAVRGTVKVLAVAIPAAVLAEYERAVTDAGYLPGAVMPSTLAALAGLDAAEGASLVVNAGPGTVTTAIVRGGDLLLHRTVDVSGDVAESSFDGSMLPLVDREGTAGEWARQEAVGYDRAPAMSSEQAELAGEPLRYEDAVVAAVNRPTVVNAEREVVQAVSVAAAYFEDTLQAPAATVLAAGSMGAGRMAEMLRDAGFEGMEVREMVEATMLSPGISTTGPGAVPRGWMAGVRGALKS